ncbi:MAG: DMT family transporter [Ignavibacteriales bacterium]|nr:DMT family transporter [Ignavibacteriales bacterium]
MINNPAQKTSGKYVGEGALLLMTLLWGGTFVIIKESLNDISSMLFVSFRYGIAASILLLIMVVRKIKIDLKSILPGMFLGLFLSLGSLTQTLGLKYTSATKSGFLTGSLVVMIPIFQMIIEKKLPSKGSMIGTLLVFFGIVFLSSGGTSIKDFLGELGANFNFGDGITLICAIFFALHIVYIDVISLKNHFWTILLMQISTASVLSFIAAFLFSGVSIESIHISITEYLIFGLLYTSVLATLFNIGLQTKFQKVVSPTKAGIIYSFEPIFAAIFAFFLLSEKITNFGLVGCALIFLGLIVSEVYDSFFEKKITNEEGRNFN